MAPDSPARNFVLQSRRFIQQAHYELGKKGDRLPASEKASGAVDQAVKAIAYHRQWRHNSHPLRRKIVDLLAAEFRQPELRDLQNSADRLHVNFYEGTLRDWPVAQDLADVTAWLESLLEVGELGGNPNFAPTWSSSGQSTGCSLPRRKLAPYP